MEQVVRRKSPRAPSIALDEAIDRVHKAYERERLHPAPTEIVAQNIGYKSANSGTALSALASLRYFGLMSRPKDGVLAVTKDFESFKYAPDEQLRRSLLVSFLRRPALYAELLEKYDSGLPSEANLKFDLIQRGFMPAAAEVAVTAFRRSVEVAGYYDSPSSVEAPSEVQHRPEESDRDDSDPSNPAPAQTASPPAARQASAAAPPAVQVQDDGLDRIPVRLPGGRRAWLWIPSPFFESDKQRLKAQIDLLLTEEDERNSDANGTST
jgi:hypothetical protein